MWHCAFGAAPRHWHAIGTLFGEVKDQNTRYLLRFRLTLHICLNIFLTLTNSDGCRSDWEEAPRGMNRIHELIYGNDNRLPSNSVVITKFYTVLIHLERIAAMILTENWTLWLMFMRLEHYLTMATSCCIIIFMSLRNMHIAVYHFAHTRTVNW